MSDGDETAPTVANRERDELRGLLGMQTRRRPAMLTEGQVLGEAYQIVRELGAGGMGVVYLARDTRLHRDVAIKVHATVAGERLLREAAALAQLVHGNVVTVHEVGSWSDHPYVVMEYVPGGTARTWAKGRGVREIVALYLAAGRGLAAAHKAGLVHRDFKPDNVLVGDDGRVRVADFGLARASGEDTPAVAEAVGELTRTGAVMGTPAYMAPEQKLGGAIEPAVDQYAFAVSLWEALAGTRPPTGQVPRALAPALRRALSEDPAARWPSMDALLADLTRAIRPSRVPWFAAGAGALALAAGGAWMLRGSSPPPSAPCAAVADDLAGIWDDAHRAALRATLPPATFDRIGRVLDGYAAEWTSQRTEACEATQVRHLQTPEVLALRDHCLDQRRGGLAAITAALADPAGGAHAFDELSGLEPVAECNDVAHLAAAPPLPADRATLDQIDAELDQANTLYYAGNLMAARAAIEPAVAQAIALAYPPQVARARLLLGTIHMVDGDRGARADFEQALKDAAAAHDDAAAGAIWVSLLTFQVTIAEDFAEAERIIPYVEASLVRVGSPAGVEASYLTRLGDLRVREHRYAEAKTVLDRAIALGEQVQGVDDPRLATPLGLLAWAQQRLGDKDAALATIQQAIDLIERAYGSDDVHLLSLLDERANFDTLDSRLDDAVAAFQRLLPLKERAFGKDSAEVAVTLSGMCEPLIFLDRGTEALPLARRAVAIDEQHAGTDNILTARAYALRADVEGAIGDLDASRADFDRAVASAEKATSLDAPEVGNLLARRGYLLLDGVDVRAGRADLARAKRISIAHPEDDELAALVAGIEATMTKGAR